MYYIIYAFFLFFRLFIVIYGFTAKMAFAFPLIRNNEEINKQSTFLTDFKGIDINSLLLSQFNFIHINNINT